MCFSKKSYLKHSLLQAVQMVGTVQTPGFVGLIVPASHLCPYRNNVQSKNENIPSRITYSDFRTVITEHTTWNLPFHKKVKTTNED